jgi:hypothetical protein
MADLPGVAGYVTYADVFESVPNKGELDEWVRAL